MPQHHDAIMSTAEHESPTRQSSRKASKLLLVVTAFIVLLLCALLLAPYLIGQERLRTLAKDLAGEHAGLELQIAQPLSLRLLPRPSIVAEGLSMHLTRGATHAGAPVPLLQIERLNASLALLPLFIGDIEITELQCTRPVLHLLRNEDGLWNWQTPSLDIDESVESGGESGQKSAEIVPAALKRISLHVVDGRVFIQDLRQKRTVDLRELQFSSEAHLQEGAVRIDPLELSGKLLGSAFPWQQTAPLALQLQADYDAGTDTAALDLKQLSLQGLSLAGALEVSQTSTSPELQGQLHLQAPLASLHTLLQGAHDTVGEGALSLRLSLQGTPQAVEFADISLQLLNKDGGREADLEGHGLLRLADTAGLELDLQGEQVHLAELPSARGRETAEESPLPQPVELLAFSDALNLDLALDLEQLLLPGLQLEDLRLRVTSRPGWVELYAPDDGPLARLAEGHLRVRLRASILEEEQLEISTDISLEGSKALALLEEVIPQEFPAAAAGAELHLATQGADWPSLAAGLDGTLQFSVQQTGADGDPDAASQGQQLLHGAFRIQGFEEEEKGEAASEDTS